MEINKAEIGTILSKYNPWWRDGIISNVSGWHRTAFDELFQWMHAPPAPRAVLLSGARQIGKTTLLQQVINALLKQGIPGVNILFASFDDWIIKNVSIDSVLQAWREREPAAPGPEYLFLDEAQFIPNIGTWVKHQVDFFKNRRIIFTGSAMPLISKEQESGVGRWHTIRLSTLSFFEYFQLNQFEVFEYKIFTDEIFIEEQIKNLTRENFKKLKDRAVKCRDQFREFIQLSQQDKDKFTASSPVLPGLPEVSDLQELFDWKSQDFLRVSELAAPYVGYFHQYLLRGGFPQIAIINDVDKAQKLLRDDLIEKVINRDMTAIFGVHNLPDLEKIFIYLCMHDGGILNMEMLRNNLQISRQTIEQYLKFLEDIHLIYRLRPFGYGKEILRSNHKIYLADPAIVPSILLKGKSLLDDPDSLARAVEAAVFKHLFIYYPHSRFTFWQNKEKDNDSEIDLIAENGEQIIPYEIKYRNKHTSNKHVKGLLELCEKNKSIKQAYVITKSINDFGIHDLEGFPHLKILHIPATLLCYWLNR